MEYARGVYPPAIRVFDKFPHEKKNFSVANQMYTMAIGRFTNSLVLRFNSIRFSLHFGAPQDVMKASRLLDETLREAMFYWQVDVMEDVFPMDYFSLYFNYRRYFDVVTEHVITGRSVREDLIKILLASLHAYAGFYDNGIEHYEKALELDDDFPFYRLRLAQHLLKRGQPADHERASELFFELADGSVFFREAIAGLNTLRTRGVVAEERVAPFAMRMMRYENSVSDNEFEDWTDLPLRPLPIVEDLRR